MVHKAIYRVIIDDGVTHLLDSELDSKEIALNRAGFLYRLTKYNAIYVQSVIGDKIDIIFDKKLVGVNLAPQHSERIINWKGASDTSKQNEKHEQQHDLEGATVIISPIFTPRKMIIKLVGGQTKWTLSASSLPISIGRDKSCNIVVLRTEVSRRHGNFSYTGATFQYTDHSSNGSYLVINNKINFVHKRSVDVNLDGILFFSKESLENTQSNQSLISFRIKNQ